MIILLLLLTFSLASVWLTQVGNYSSRKNSVIPPQKSFGVKKTYLALSTAVCFLSPLEADFLLAVLSSAEIVSTWMKYFSPANSQLRHYFKIGLKFGCIAILHKLPFNDRFCVCYCQLKENKNACASNHKIRLVGLFNRF